MPVRAVHADAPDSEWDAGAQPVVLGVTLDLAVVDLVAVQRRVPLPQGLLPREGDVGVEQAEALDEAGPGFHRVVDALAEHLEAAADAEHRLALPRRAR